MWQNRLGSPSENRAGIRHRIGKMLVRQGNEIHRDDRNEEDDRELVTRLAGTGPQGAGQGVSWGRCGQPDGHRTDERDRSLLESLGLHSGRRVNKFLFFTHDRSAVPLEGFCGRERASRLRMLPLNFGQYIWGAKSQRRRKNGDFTGPPRESLERKVDIPANS